MELSAKHNPERFITVEELIKSEKTKQNRRLSQGKRFPLTKDGQKWFLTMDKQRSEANGLM